MPRVYPLLLCTLLLVSALWTRPLPAQVKAADSPHIDQVTLGRSSVPLEGPWRFQPGDSPLLGGKPVWAATGFPDDRWPELFFSSDPKAAADAPGWMGRGYPQLDRGFAWYRLTVHPGAATEPLWLQMPATYDDAYQVYANGNLLGGTGFRNGHPTAFYARTFAFPLPPPDARGNLEIALRLWLDPNTHFDDPTAGGLHTPPLIGLASTVHAAQQREFTATVLNKVAMEGFLPLFYLLAAAVAFWAWLRVQREQAYLWLSLRLLVNILGALSYDLALAGLLPANTDTFLQSVVFRSVITPLWIVFWWHWFQLRRDRWILHGALLITVLDFVSAMLARATVHGTVPAHWADWLSPANTLIKTCALLLLAVIFFKGLRRNRTEALLALVPLAINEVVIFNNFALEGRFGWNAPVLGMHLPPSAVAALVLVLTIGVLAIRRFLALHARQVLNQQTLEAELTQASELQKRVLVPETGQSPFFRVETAYLPAQIMGGDFFQILSHPDGSTLIILGDVSGKGVTAAFLVAVLVGAIRTQADRSLHPVQMLTMLNARLIDRSEGHFATCLAVLLDPAGRAVIANAGHLPPYLDGEEIEGVGALPLGLVPDLLLETQTLQLKPGEQLTLVSDGIVEAMDAKGELFGFDRTRAISRSTAQQIAAGSRSFGQTDDITVVTIQYVGAPELALASSL